MGSWTADRVLSLAPDSASAAAGQSLANVKKWSAIGQSDRAIWGFCQGSGKDPYHTRIDLAEPAFKCSCPSRKFPCKHGLALLLLFAKDDSAFKSQNEPGWVTDWLDSRRDRVEKKAAKAEVEPKTVDAEAQAKRAAQRDARVQDGIATCRLWLDDLARRGLAAAQQEKSTFWSQLAARMVDAQAPGLARHIAQLPDLISSGDGWELRTLDALGRLHLLLKAGEQLATLPPDLAIDVRTALGWNQSKEDALTGEGVQDRWLAVGSIIEDEDRVRVRRTWLIGRSTHRRALLLDFAAGAAPLPSSAAAGTEFDAEVAFYPGRLALRAQTKSRGDTLPLAPDLGLAADTSINDALRRYAHALAANPWLARWPLLLRAIRPTRIGDRWFLIDADTVALPIHPTFINGTGLWRLLAISGGRPLTILAEWDGSLALPLSAIDTSALHDLAPRWAA
jgi:hypothetical protein